MSWGRPHPIKPSLHASLLAALALGGCGGRIHRAAPVVPVAASVLPFVGTWTGSYGVAGQPSLGTVTIVVAPPPTPATPGARLSGTIAGAGTLQGSISTRPNLDQPELSPSASFDFQFPDSPPDAGGDVEHQCTARIDARGHLILTHVPGQTSGAFFAPEDFDLAPITAPTPEKTPRLGGTFAKAVDSAMRGSKRT